MNSNMNTSTVLSLNSNQSCYLDFLRGLSALAVLFGHTAKIFQPNSFLAHSGIETIGVFVFFLLSGFLISFTTLKRYNDPSYSFRSFFIDRFCRIYCAFIPAIILVLIIDKLSLHYGLLPPADQSANFLPFQNIENRSSLIQFIGNLFMLQDHPLFQIARVVGIESTYFIRPFGTAAPFWTISIEWWLYMFFGILLLVYIRAGKLPKLWHLPFLGLIAIPPFYHFVSGPDQCLSMLWGVGIVVCYLFVRQVTLPKIIMDNKTISAFIFGSAGVFLCLFRIVSIKIDGGNGTTELQFGAFLALAIFGFLFFFDDKRRLPSFISKPLWFLADYSYSLYLIHFSVIGLVLGLMPDSTQNVKAFWITILMSNLISIIFWYFFERHHKKIGKLLKAKTQKSC